jgi:dihydroorotase
MTEAKLRPTLVSPLTMIVSDGGTGENNSAHPRIAGTYARVLGKYVREEKVLTLMEALRKMTLMPAQRLEARATVMRNKGRIRVGADADITVFDPTTVIDRSTFKHPLQPSMGIPYVIVNGISVVNAGVVDTTAVPGRGIRARSVHRSSQHQP